MTLIGPASRLPFPVEFNLAALLRGVQQVHSIDAGLDNFHGHIEAFIWLGPTDVQLMVGR
jgi:hypothetical protein